jgi:hypothetical protein
MVHIFNKSECRLELDFIISVITCTLTILTPYICTCPTTLSIGASKDTAKNMLEVYHGDVEMAINMFLEDQDGASSSSHVRDPIPPQQAVLVDIPGSQRFRNRRKRAPYSVFDKFRDFQVETRKFVMSANRRMHESLCFCFQIKFM